MYVTGLRYFQSVVPCAHHHHHPHQAPRHGHEHSRQDMYAPGPLPTTLQHNHAPPETPVAEAPSLVAQLQQVHGLTKKKVYGAKPIRQPFFRDEKVMEKPARKLVSPRPRMHPYHSSRSATYPGPSADKVEFPILPYDDAGYAYPRSSHSDYISSPVQEWPSSSFPTASYHPAFSDPGPGPLPIPYQQSSSSYFPEPDPALPPYQPQLYGDHGVEAEVEAGPPPEVPISSDPELEYPYQDFAGEPHSDSRYSSPQSSAGSSSLKGWAG